MESSRRSTRSSRRNSVSDDNHRGSGKRSRSRSRTRSRDRKIERNTRSRRRASSVESVQEKNDAAKRQREEDAVPATSTANDDGEISLSIEETNALRARLGLKPLTESNKVKQAEQNYRDKKQQELEAKQAEEVRANIEKARNKRLLKEKLEGPTLGEATGEDASLLSAADWVRRSRVKEAESKEKQQLRKLEQMFEEQDENLLSGVPVEAYTTKDLKGLAVTHGAHEFQEGHDVILTLKDSSILQRDEHGKIIDVAEDGDELENAQLVEAQKAKDREKRKKRSRQPGYAGYDDEEFTSGKKTNILSQYDEEKKRGPALTLDGQEKMAIAADDEEIDDTTMVGNKSKPQSLAVETRAAAEYYTQAEFAKFTKPKKKKKKIRKQTVDDEEQDASILAEESSAVSATNHADHGSRSKQTGSAATAKLAAEQEEKLAAYNRAKAKANLEAEKARQSAQAVEFVDDLDTDLSMSLARVRRLAQTKRREQPIEDAGAAITQQLMEAARLASASEAKMELGEEDDLDAEGRRKDGTLVFTSTTEFTTRLQARLQERARDKAENVAREQEGTTKKASHAVTEHEHPMDIGAGTEASQDGESASDAEEEVLFTHDQPLVRKGLAATIALLNSTGELHKKEKLAGRANDARDINTNDVVKDIKLEYRDEFGRLLTPKEAFRLQSYVFHGEGPGKKAQAKRLKQRDIELKAQTSRDPLSGSLSVLSKTQEATGKAYLLLQGGGGTSSAAVAADMAQSIVKNKSKGKARK